MTHHSTRRILRFAVGCSAAGLLLLAACGGLDRAKKAVGADPDKGERPHVLTVEISGPITPSTMERLEQAIEAAQNRKSSALLVFLNTPGGLMPAMDEMCRNILNSPVPVITYVYPPGAYAGSAGVYIMYSSQLAAMAPATNIGSATPVQMGGGGGEKEEKARDRIPEKAGADDALNMKRKLLHHAQAQIRGFAEFHGRNSTFAERTITHAENVTSGEALRLRAIEIVASSPEDLIRQAEGRTVRLITGPHTLKLKGLPLEALQTDFRSEFLRVLTNPVVVNLLMMIGVLGILAEIQYPGSIFPGAVGAICLLLGLYAMQQLPVNYAGIALIGLGVLFFILEIKIVSYGLLSIAGVICLLIGSILLAKTGDELLWSTLMAILTTTAVIAAVMFFLVYKAAQVLRTRRVPGMDTLDGMSGEAMSDVTPEGGQVFVHSEIWSARTASGTIPKGAAVRVVSRDGMVFTVEKAVAQAATAVAADPYQNA